jgi:hypothetical protein
MQQEVRSMRTNVRGMIVWPHRSINKFAYDRTRITKLNMTFSTRPPLHGDSFYQVFYSRILNYQFNLAPWRRKLI